MATGGLAWESVSLRPRSMSEAIAYCVTPARGGASQFQKTCSDRRKPTTRVPIETAKATPDRSKIVSTDENGLRSRAWSGREV